MNFLAHLYLSGDDPKVMVGNFIADFVKGKNVASRFEPGIAFGIELHRSIDAFTDKHPVVKLSKKRLWEKYRHYAAVIVDMYYDHFLSNTWQQFHPLPLSLYSAQTYRTLEEHREVLPDRLKVLLSYMIKGNWLVGYGSIDGIGQALTGMSRRTPYDSKMDESTEDLSANYESFKREFLEFFPELNAYAQEILKQRKAT